MIKIRQATPRDCPTILSYIRELATAEGFPDRLAIDSKILERFGFGDEKIFSALMLMYGDRVVGYCLYYHRFSTWDGKTIELEDIFIEEPFRGKGIGRQVFQYVASVAYETGCGRLEWQVHHQALPKTVNFYERLGAYFDQGVWRCQIIGRESIFNLSQGKG
jgi:GNAT superfamily N-acetyltransferase